MKNRLKAERDVAAIKFIFLASTLLRFVDSFSAHSSIQSLIAKHTKPRRRKGKKRSANKGRWDHIHFSIRSFIQPHSLETKILRRTNGNFLRLASSHHLCFCQEHREEQISVLLTQIFSMIISDSQILPLHHKFGWSCYRLRDSATKP